MIETKKFDKFVILSLCVIAVIMLFNFYSLAKINSALGNKNFGSIASSSLVSNVAATDVIPTGTPNIYGAELKVSFDDITPNNPQLADAAIRKLGVLDEQIVLSGDDLNRYISIVSKISCEYCCGAPSIIFDNGDAACGCAHSYAMRGLAKYLISEHGSEFADDQILEELGKWKTLFFPGQITQKAAILKQQGIELNYINLASNKYRGIESGTGGGGMVGGC